ncbi:MAG TPA: PLP-dependent aspartate aminotransferase family protein [Rhizomicrobium sp.]|jgi:cystathionine gamma-synthase|nr:PLP-dependent aspartate aminotransferase family protein [Rhizomicrobium sp.]
MQKKKQSPETFAAQALGWIDHATRAVVPPLHVSTTFEREPDNTFLNGRSYARADSPAFDQGEALLAQLEGGAEAMLFASGMAAATCVFHSLAPGDHIVAPQGMYWALRAWLAADSRLEVSFVDATDLKAIERAIVPGRTKLIWVETPANPLWDITDIEAVAALVHSTGARLAVDSTVATPVFTQPLALGADLVMHSATKYLNGHSDVVAGALVTRENDACWQKLKNQRVKLGAILGSFESWLLTRGMRTLYPRVRLAASNALELARRLDAHPKIAQVLYPGLPQFPGHDIAARQMQGGFGAMLSIRIRGGEDAAIAAAGKIRVWKRATSLGGVESLVEHRASVEGPDSPCPRDLLRLSVGIENVEDLWFDLAQALASPD